MTRKDYAAIAAVLHKRIEETDSMGEIRDRLIIRTTVRMIVWELIPAFERDNPRFDRKQFLDAVWAL